MLDQLSRKVVDQRHLGDLLAQRALVRQGMDAGTVEQLRQQMERAMAKRIHPHDVHDFFLEAFRWLGGKVNPREKGRYERICFEKAHVADSPRAELVSPGHPPLQACMSLVMKCDGAVLGQGGGAGG